MLTIRQDDRPAVNSFKEMLSFYGVQLQSHAAMILGLALLTFAVVQAWGQLASAGKLNSYHAPVFSLLVGFIGIGIAYQLWRLYAFGKFASALFSSSDQSLQDTQDEWNLKYKDKPEAQWEHLLPLTQVGVHAERLFRIGANKWWFRFRILRLVDKRVRPTPLVMVLGFEVSFASSYSLLFGTVDFFLAVFVLSSVVAVLFVYYYLWRFIYNFVWKRMIRFNPKTNETLARSN